jgi:glycosyltransferase A (GT-A) superfamily protein (DUF2064 family)
MDSPELSPTAVAQSLGTARRGGCAALRPATDGGYVLLTLPPAAPTKVSVHIFIMRNVLARSYNTIILE